MLRHVASTAASRTAAVPYKELAAVTSLAMARGLAEDAGNETVIDGGGKEKDDDTLKNVGIGVCATCCCCACMFCMQQGYCDDGC